jgi:hypothetical protein
MSDPVHHQLDLYGTHVHVAYNPVEWNKLRRKFPSKLETWSEANGVATTYDETFPNGEHHIAFRLNVKPGDNDPGLVGIIAHEAFHGALSVCDKVGFTVVTHNDEPAAYLAQWFADFIWNNRP